jgi:hypothetical protein
VSSIRGTAVQLLARGGVPHLRVQVGFPRHALATTKNLVSIGRVFRPAPAQALRIGRVEKSCERLRQWLIVWPSLATSRLSPLFLPAQRQ